jgi:hypothetical protein
MVCIYCKGDSSSSRGVPHVLPEALSKNELKLPRGVECDGCNQYAGRRLESNLIRYPQVAFAIQFLGAPGKRGVTRQQIGGIRRERVDSNSVRVSLKLKGQPTVTANDKLRIESRIVPERQFNPLAFRRVLHHAGLNLVAALNGVDSALEPKYDAVREYVRNPKPANASWAYGQIDGKGNDIPRLIGCGFADFEDTELARLQVFQIQFFIDLLNTGALEAAMKTIGGVYVAPEDSLPEATFVVEGKVSQHDAV